jgi:hypothetical protein
MCIISGYRQDVLCSVLPCSQALQFYSGHSGSPPYTTTQPPGSLVRWWCSPRTALLEAAWLGRGRVVERLVRKHKARPNARDAQGRTAYEIAVERAFPDIQATLVGWGLV